MEDNAGLHSPRKGTKRRIKQEENSKEDYNDEEKGMDTNKEGNVREEGTSQA